MLTTRSGLLEHLNTNIGYGVLEMLKGVDLSDGGLLGCDAKDN